MVFKCYLFETQFQKPAEKKTHLIDQNTCSG